MIDDSNNQSDLIRSSCKVFCLFLGGTNFNNIGIKLKIRCNFIEIADSIWISTMHALPLSWQVALNRASKRFSNCFNECTQLKSLHCEDFT